MTTKQNTFSTLKIRRPSKKARPLGGVDVPQLVPVPWYNDSAILDYTIKELADIVLKRGGHINKFYLQERNKNKHTVIFLNGWFGGKNVREALLKALA